MKQIGKHYEKQPTRDDRSGPRSLCINQYNYSYDAAGNLISFAPPVVAASTYAYDATHLLTTELDPLGNSDTTTYYPTEKAQQVTDAAGQATSYAYNLSTRTNIITKPDGGTVVTVNDVYGSQ